MPPFSTFVPFFADVFHMKDQYWIEFNQKLKHSYPTCEREYTNREIHKEYRRFLKGVFRYGFDLKDWFVYQLMRYNDSELKTYISHDYWLYLDEKTNEHEYWDIFMDKAVFYDYFKQYMSRDVLIVKDENDRDAFMSLCRKHNKLIVKPCRAHRGEGVEIIHVETPEKIEAAWEKVLQNKLLVEEVVKQNPATKRFHEDSLNSLRICTVLDKKGEPFVMAAAIRFGSAGSNVDNVSNGSGIFAGVDVNDGTLFSPGYDINTKEYLYHPDSKLLIPGTKIPEWPKLLELAKKAALEVPQMRYIGWDWALDENDHWELIEGNNPGTMIMPQVSQHKGLKKEFTEKLLG